MASRLLLFIYVLVLTWTSHHHNSWFQRIGRRLFSHPDIVSKNVRLLASDDNNQTNSIYEPAVWLKIKVSVCWVKKKPQVRLKSNWGQSADNTTLLSAKVRAKIVVFMLIHKMLFIFKSWQYGYLRAVVYDT